MDYSTRMHTCRAVLFFLVLTLTASSIEASCQIFVNLISCRFTAPSMENLEAARTLSNVVIKDYRGALTTTTAKGTKNYSVMSLQISTSHINYLQARYFAAFSNNALTHLTLNSVNGSFQLDALTLGGLENTLESLRVNDYQLADVSHVTKLKKLDTLFLARTGLKQLPDNFAMFMEQLTKLDLSSNELTTMPWDAVARRLEDVRFITLRLGKNPWICDCRLKPMVEASTAAKQKVTPFQCSTPEELKGVPFRALKVTDICSNELKVVDASPNKPIIGEPETENTLEGTGGRVDGSQQGADAQRGGMDEKPKSDLEIATAGGMSTEVIAVIAAVVVVVVIVLIAVIVFKLRSRSHKRTQQEAEKSPSHKNNTYCHVIETSDVKPRPSGAAVAGPPPAQRCRRELDEAERQPLAPPYHTHRDNRL